MEYKNKTIYLLDDGARPEIEFLTIELGCEYIARKNGKHAKAGNINHALPKTKGEIIAFFDADCIPTRNFLTRTLGFFQKENTGLVIAGQSYYNAESVSQNMCLSSICSNSFSKMQEGRDTYNALLCFGTGFLIRRTALNKIGGIPHETLSEDWATSILLQSSGYKTYYVRDFLTSGASAENMREFLKQRLRWARGTI